MLEYATLSISREATLREARATAARRGPTLNPKQETAARRARLQHLEAELAASRRASRDPVREVILDELARRRALAEFRPILMIRRGGPS